MDIKSVTIRLPSAPNTLKMQSSLMFDISLSFWSVQLFEISLCSVTFLLNMFLLLDTSVHDPFLLIFISVQDFFLKLTVWPPPQEWSLFFHVSIQLCSLRFDISIKISAKCSTLLFNTGLCPSRYPFKIVLLCFIQESANGTCNKSSENDS
jgi:hypothetical protein